MVMGTIAIRVENLSKQYRIGGPQAQYRTMRETMMDLAAAPARRLRRLGQPTPEEETIWALRDVSFEVKHGEVLGIIGRNGAGKTTLLKILSRITEPTEGRAEISGRVGSLLEVGTGFHPELTGRENIYLNGAILGMKRAEIDDKFDEIVAFSEIEKFLDTPVKRYSSGMYVRLAFSVAAHLEPEILLVDEVLAVGDAAFQKKCLGKMEGVAEEGRTVLFVSHNMNSISQLCAEAILLEEGKLRSIGEVRRIVHEYLSSQTTVTGSWERPSDSVSSRDSELQIMMARVLSHDGQQVSAVEFDRSFHVEIEYEVTRVLHGCALALQMLDSQGRVILTTWDTDGNEVLRERRMPGVYSSTCKLPAHLLRPGVYSLTLAAHIPNVKILDLWESALGFEVLSVGGSIKQNRVGIIAPLLDWELRFR
jgi:lipopolysaccharide transport system ATP-binding protein